MMETLTRETVSSGFSYPVDFFSSRERGRWGESFVLALVVHAVLLWGVSRGLFHSPEYGIQGSSASMEVYMVAAAPESAAKPQVQPLKEDPAQELIEAASEMEAARLPGSESLVKKADLKETPAFKKDPEKSSDAVGDGSSSEPGPSTTTFFSRGSSETAGKAGKYLNPPPPYPRLAQQKGWQGVVVLKAMIKQEGRPARVFVEKSSGHRVLDEAALSAVRQWQFTAASILGHETEAWLQVPVRFVLEEMGSSN